LDVRAQQEPLDAVVNVVNLAEMVSLDVPED